MKKFIFLLVLGLGISRASSAQNAINSVHFYDVKNAAMEKTYIASLNEINAIMVEIGYPKNYYSHLKLAASDTTKTYRNCTIGHWNSEAEYKAIHEHPKFKAWSEKNKGNNAVFISGQLYRKFYAD
jgi:hypothetical protein